MKLAIFSVLIALALATAGVQGAALQDSGADAGSNGDLGIALTLFIQAFQKIMPCGYAPMGIPVLAPFSLPYYEFNVTTDAARAHGHVANMLIAGLNKFRILANSYNSTTGRFYFDIIYPEFQILAEDKLKEWILIAGLPIHFDVDGLLNLKIQDLRSINEFSIVENANGTLQMKFHELNFYIGGVVSSSWNKKWDISLNNFMNRWFEESVMMFSEQIQPVLKELYSEYLLSYANWGLSQVTMGQLVETYMSLAAEFNAADCQLSGNLA